MHHIQKLLDVKRLGFHCSIVGRGSANLDDSKEFYCNNVQRVTLRIPTRIAVSKRLNALLVPCP